MNYTEKDFDNLQFNPMCDGKIIKKYPALKDVIDENIEADGDSLDALLRYTIFTCEPKSSLVISERDFKYRKEVAADLSGLSKDEDYRDSVFTYKDKSALNLCVNYLVKFSKSKEFSAIMVFENCYQENIRLLLKPIDDKDAKDKDVLDAVQKKSLIKNEIIEDLKRVDNLYQLFYGEDTELLNKAKGMLKAENIRERRGKNNSVCSKK